MTRLFSVMLFVLFFASPSWADLVIGPYNVDLPDDLHITDCEDCTADQVSLLWKPLSNAKNLTAYYDYLIANDIGDVYGEQLNQGIAGHLDLFYQPRDENQKSLPFEELHVLQCSDFREQWSYGFCDFDQARKLGHIATAMGAMVYAVCRYDEKSIICASGLDYIELSYALDGTEHPSARQFSRAWEQYENLPSPEAEHGLLNALRAAGNVAKIEELFGKITLTNGN